MRHSPTGATLDTLRLDTDGHGAGGIRIEINGTSLITLVQAVEQPFAAREGSPQIAGAYAWLHASDLVPWGHGPSSDPLTVGRWRVLGCDCGEAECWPLYVSISADRDVVSWSSFENPYRSREKVAERWDYTALGPFRFDADAYEDERAKLRRTS